MATVQEFTLLQKSAITDIQADLEAAVEADRIAAQAAASTATTKANESAASSVKASQWAENNEDVAVETGKFSAKHYSLKAGAQNAQMQAVYPTAAYRSMVLADSGNIQDLNKLTELYIKNLQLLDSTVFLWSGVSGMKTRTSGSNQFASKLYNMANKVQQFGSNIVINGTFDTDSGWNKETGWSIDTVNKVAVASSVTSSGLFQSKTYENNVTYHVQVTIKSYSSGTLRFAPIQPGLYFTFPKAVGTYIISFVGNGLTGQARLDSTDGFTGTVDDFVIRRMDWVEGTNDAIQTTEANQPYVGGVIAPNEARKLKSLMNGRRIEHQTLQLSSFSGFSITTVLNSTGLSTIGTYAIGTLGIYLSRTAIALYHPQTGGLVFTVPVQEIRKPSNKIITINAYAGGIAVYLNSVQMPLTIGTYTPFVGSLSRMFDPSTTESMDGTILYHQIHNRALSASEIQAQHEYLRLQIPEIEGIAIGNQYWPTSNYEAGVAGDGVVIPQVTDNTAWAALTTLAWDYHTSSVDNGAIYGKIYNGYAADKLALKPPTGYRVMSRADWLQLSSVIGANSNKLKVTGTDYWAAANGTNETGFSAIGGGYRNADGTFSTLKADVWYWTSDKYLVKIASGSGTITVTDGSSTLGIGAYIRLIRNQPVGPNERTITSTTIVSDIASTANSTQIPFGYSVASIRLKTTANLTNIKVELWNNFYSGTPTLVATLITDKTANNTTMVFPVIADCPALLQDGTLRITATGANTFETIVEYNLQKNTF